MTFKEIFNQLEGLGTEQNRKLYMRRGSGQHTFGVSLANLRNLAQGIGKDNEIAFALFASKNVDAHSLATMVADPKEFEFKTANTWLKKTNYSVVINFIAALVAKTKFRKKALKQWTSSKKENVKAAGYDLLTHLLKKKVDLEENEINFYLIEIANEIHKSSNLVRSSMNKALIAIGSYRISLSKEAIRVAKRIGSVFIDSDKTACELPNAAIQIEKALNKSVKQN